MAKIGWKTIITSYHNFLSELIGLLEKKDDSFLPIIKFLSRSPTFAPTGIPVAHCDLSEVSEEEFLEAIYENQGLIHKICTIYRDSKEDREDLFQEITYQLWKAFPKFQSRSKFTTWMYRIGLNTALATFRKPKIKMTRMEKLPETYGKESNENPNREILFRAIRQLEDTEKGIISMYLDGFDNAEMADVIGISKNHLGVKLNRIKNKLRTILNK